MDKEVVVHVYNGILFKYKKNKNLVICNNMDGPGGIMLSEVRQTEKDRLCDFTYIWNLKPETKQMNKHKKTEIHRYREQTSNSQEVGRRGQEKIR